MSGFENNVWTQENLEVFILLREEGFWQEEKDKNIERQFKMSENQLNKKEAIQNERMPQMNHFLLTVERLENMSKQSHRVKNESEQVSG